MGLGYVDKKGQIITTEDQNRGDDQRRGMQLIREGLNLYRPQGTELVGIIFAGYYRSMFTNEIQIVSDSNMGGLSEGTANDGWKALGGHIKKFFQGDTRNRKG